MSNGMDMQQAVQDAYQVIAVEMRYAPRLFLASDIFEKMRSYAKHLPLDERMQWFVTASSEERAAFEEAWAGYLLQAETRASEDQKPQIA